MKYTFRQFQAQYPDDGACLDAILLRKYGKEPTCPGCGVEKTKFSRISGRRAYACQWCGHHVYPCVGTPFEKSSTSLTLWFHAMYLMTATRNGVSAKELERQLGVTYKCAWRIGQQLRDLMAAKDQAGNVGPLTGHVEIDETYIGGRLRKFHGHGKGDYLKNKSTVMGIVQRGGNVRTAIIPNERGGTMLPIIQANVAEGATISTDDHGTYRVLPKLGFNHGKVNHNIDEWRNGIHCTNTIEGFWSHLKRGIKSTHASVSKRHLQKYVDEFSFRYNMRHDPAGMFNQLMASL